MIKYEDLDHGGPDRNGEVLFTWEDPETGKLRSWAIGRLAAHLERTKHQAVLCGPIDDEQAMFIVENRGVEMHRLKWLADPANVDALATPSILMRMYDSEGEPHDLTLDGHHRFVVLASFGMPSFPAYHLSEEEAEPFEVSGMPDMDMTVLVNSFSGIGEIA